jgi:hypothetical protein
LNFFGQRRNAFCLGQLFGSRIATGIWFSRHKLQRTPDDDQAAHAKRNVDIQVVHPYRTQLQLDSTRIFRIWSRPLV